MQSYRDTLPERRQPGMEIARREECHAQLARGPGSQWQRGREHQTRGDTRLHRLLRVDLTSSKNRWPSLKSKKPRRLLRRGIPRLDDGRTGLVIRS
jgi:hypothetical protein